MLKVVQSLLFLFFLSLLSCIPKPLTNQLGHPDWGVQITWHGHSCFSLKDSVGRVLVIDPFDATVGYGILSLRADALLVTHEHFDHNAKSLVYPLRRELDLVQSTGSHDVAGGMGVYGFLTDHDKVNGEIHGRNIVYVFNFGGLKMAHLGDIGTEPLPADVATSLKNCDVLFIPVGGVTTINASQAKKLVQELSPHFVFPMHYGERRFFPLDPVEKFTMLFDEDQIVKKSDSMVHLRASHQKDKMRIFVLSPTQNVD